MCHHVAIIVVVGLMVAAHDLVDVRLRGHVVLVIAAPAHVRTELRVVEVFAALLDGEEDFAGFVAELCPLVPEVIVEIHVFPRFFCGVLDIFIFNIILTWSEKSIKQ